MKYLLTTITILIGISSFSQEVKYKYDNLGRLEEAIYNDSLKIEYTYDELGNRLTKAVTDIYGTVPVCNQYNISAGAEQYCEGSGGVSVNLSNSDAGFTYELYKDGNPTGITQQGTGSYLTWSNNLFGTYTVVSSNGTETCTMNGSVSITENSFPLVYNLSVSANEYCENSNGVTISLENSGTGVNYELFNNGITTGNTIPGTGTNLLWENILEGTYTIYATNTASYCGNEMNGSETITENPLPEIYDLTISANTYSGASGVEVYLSSSEIGINYELYKNGNPTGLTQAGTGSGLVWNNQLAGTYTIVATHATTLCSETMNGSEIVLEESTDPPTATFISGDAEICAGESTDLIIELTNGSWILNYTDGTDNFEITITESPYHLTVNPSVTTTYTMISVENTSQAGDIIYGPPPYSGSVTVTVNQLPQFDFININSVQCFGESNGTAEVNLISGSFPFTYLWDNGVTDALNETLSGGEHQVSVTDGNICTNTASVIIPEPNELIINTDYVINANCLGEATGEIKVSAQGGTASYTYQWDNGQTGQIASSLLQGEYTVTVTDAHNCMKSITVSVGQDPVVFANINTSTNVNCYGEDTGTAAVTVSGGQEPFEYLWSNGQTAQTAVNLVAGDYSVIVTDANNCTDVASITISQPDELEANLVSENISCDGSILGSASIELTGGQTPYSYIWSTGETSSSINNLIEGTYTIAVQDANNCIPDGSPYSFSISQDPTPNALINIISGSVTPCDGSEVILQASGGDTYLWSTGETSSEITIYPSVSAWYSVNAFFNGSTCEGNDSIYIDVQDNPVITFNLPDDICQQADPINLPDYVSVTPNNGGNFVFSGQGIVNDIFYPSTVNVGTYLITVNYTDPVSGCEDSAEELIAVHGDPVVTLTLPFENLCINDDPVLLSGGIPEGGIYYGDGVNSQTGIFNPGEAGEGLHLITYAYTDQYGCSASWSDYIMVNEPVTTVIYIEPGTQWCTGDGPLNINVYPSGGVVTANGLTIAQIDESTFLFDPDVAGLYELIYTINSTCLSADTGYVQVEETPDVYFVDLPSNVYITDPPFQIVGLPVGGLVTIDGNISGSWFDPSIWGFPGGTVDRTIGYEVTIAWCSGYTEDILTVTDSTVNSLEELEMNTLINMYPNPATDELHIEILNDINIYKINIVDILGSEVYSEKIQSKKKLIDISAFANSVYLVNFIGINDTVIATKRFMKK